MAGREPAKKSRPTDVDEKRLVEAARRDRARFADVYENYFHLVYAYVARRMRDRAATEDLTAEVFHKALASLPRFKWTGAPFAAWLFRIASNLIADRAKREARESKMSWQQSGAAARRSSPTVGEGAAAQVVTRGLQARSDLAEAQQADLEAAERRALLFSVVDQLPDDQRRVIAMRFGEEKSIREIAEELSRSEGAVKQLQFRALENLRRKIHHREHRED
jgi:RNA polymerase sigma-70 factor, ECF subfamily